MNPNFPKRVTSSVAIKIKPPETISFSGDTEIKPKVEERRVQPESKLEEQDREGMIAYLDALYDHLEALENDKQRTIQMINKTRARIGPCGKCGKKK